MSPPVDDNLLEVQGFLLRYVVQGDGIPVLVVGSAVYYPRTFSPELRAFCRLVFIDLRHFAERRDSAVAGQVTIEAYTADIEAVRARLGLERVVILGHSHHGNVALEYAKRYPDRVSHVVILGSPPADVATTLRAATRYWNDHASPMRKRILRDRQAALDAGYLQRLTPEAEFVAHYVADAPKYWYDPCYDASFLWENVPIDMAALGAFRGFFSAYELSWDPVRLNVPVLVVMGRYDYAVPHVLWDPVLPKLRNVTYHLFERSGHTPQLEEPQLFDQVLSDWLS